MDLRVWSIGLADREDCPELSTGPKNSTGLRHRFEGESFDIAHL
jgi:hypothetical protein